MGVCRVIPNRECIAVHSLIQVNTREEQRIRVLSRCNTYYRSKKRRDKAKVEVIIKKKMKNELIRANHHKRSNIRRQNCVCPWDFLWILKATDHIIVKRMVMSLKLEATLCKSTVDHPWKRKFYSKTELCFIIDLLNPVWQHWNKW
jgi:hypothetical protein